MKPQNGQFSPPKNFFLPIFKPRFMVIYPYIYFNYSFIYLFYVLYNYSLYVYLLYFRAFFVFPDFSTCTILFTILKDNWCGARTFIYFKLLFFKDLITVLCIIELYSLYLRLLEGL